MNDNNLKDAFEIAYNQIREEYIKNNQKNVFDLWFNIKYVKDDIKTITVAVPNRFLWDSMKERGNIKKICDLIKKLFALSELEIIPEIKDELIYNANESDSKNEIQEETKVIEVKHEQPKKNNNLPVEKFTFENFISGEGTATNFAYKVALSVAENPGIKANPVLFYGGVGLGKTHLMRAIGNRIKEKYPTKKICYIQAESFLNEFTDSMYKKTQNAFKNKYRKLDVLLLDDIQFLQNKNGIQEELFYTFEAIKEKNGQMVFACDRPLTEIENMADRLVGRLGSGLCLDIQPPNYETRKSIILKNLEIQNQKLPEDVIDLIAKVIETNIRDLEAAIMKITNYAEYLDSPITVEIAQEQLSSFYNSPKTGNISIENIFKVVATNYGITVEDIKSKKREKKISDPRHIALYLAKELTELTFSELGHQCGGRDHSSIMHAVEKIENLCKTDPNLNQMISMLTKEIKKFKN